MARCGRYRWAREIGRLKDIWDHEPGVDTLRLEADYNVVDWFYGQVGAIVGRWALYCGHRVLWAGGCYCGQVGAILWPSCGVVGR